jgi:hypothetical protein
MATYLCMIEGSDKLCWLKPMQLCIKYFKDMLNFKNSNYSIIFIIILTIIILIEFAFFRQIKTRRTQFDDSNG